MSDVIPITLDRELKAIKADIVSLENRARELENWLIKNTQDCNWFREDSKYNDILFRLNQKKQKLESVSSGNISAPETLTLPSRANRNRGF
jgi:hypothetical protein